MRKKWMCVIAPLMLAVTLLASGVASAGDLVVGFRGFYGFAGGSTDDPGKTGDIGSSVGGGLSVQYYFITKGRMNLGLASGLDYVHLRYDSESTLNTSSVPGIPYDTALNAQTSYSYLTVPLTIRALYAINEKLALTADAGAFLGLFLGGKSNNDYTPETPLLGITDGVEDLNKDTTESMDIGLRFAAGLAMDVSKKLKLTPGILFDLGLKDTSKDQQLVTPSKDTFWKLTGMVTFVYELF